MKLPEPMEKLAAALLAVWLVCAVYALVALLLFGRAWS